MPPGRETGSEAYIIVSEHIKSVKESWLNMFNANKIKQNISKFINKLYIFDVDLGMWQPLESKLPTFFN